MNDDIVDTIPKKRGRKTINLIGQKFGRLTVIEKSNRRDCNRSTIWECQCDCENKTIREIRGSSLINGNTKSCGCFQKESVSRLKRIPYGEASKNYILRGYKRSAKKRNLEFNLTFDEFINLTSKNCYYCGIEPKQTAKSYFKNHNFNEEYIYNGIDRVDNNLGYTLDNCVPCCKFCNGAKSNLSKEEFLNHIKSIYENLHLENYERI